MVDLVYLVFVMGFYGFDQGCFDSFCWDVAVGIVGYFGIGNYFDVVGCFDIDDCFDIGFVDRCFVFGSFHGCMSVGCSLYFVNAGVDLAVGNVESCVRCQTI
jgi:hypothetical protein